MRNNSYFKNSIYLGLILLLFIVQTFLLKNYELQMQQTFKPNLIYVTLINLLSGGGIGIILGLDNISAYSSKEGKWKVNKMKLIVLGIPSFMVSMIYVWMLLGMRFKYMPNDYVIIISNVVLGHALISSLYKN